MHSLGIKDVEFIVCNTDIQALHSSTVNNKLQIGINLTEGLGAGADPEKGKNAAKESSHEIREILKSDTKSLAETPESIDSLIKSITSTISLLLILLNNFI